MKVAFRQTPLSNLTNTYSKNIKAGGQMGFGNETWFLPIPQPAEISHCRFLFVETGLSRGGGHVAGIALLAHEAGEFSRSGGLHVFRGSV